MFANCLIGLREGLGAGLVVWILVACRVKCGNRSMLPPIRLGVGIAGALSVTVGAVLQCGSAQLTFEGQEMLGGAQSVIAVALVTWMVFWTRRTTPASEGELHGKPDQALAIGTGALTAPASSPSVAKAWKPPSSCGPPSRPRTTKPAHAPAPSSVCSPPGVACGGLQQGGHAAPARAPQEGGDVQGGFVGKRERHRNTRHGDGDRLALRRNGRHAPRVPGEQGPGRTGGDTREWRVLTWLLAVLGRAP